MRKMKRLMNTALVLFLLGYTLIPFVATRDFTKIAAKELAKHSQLANSINDKMLEIIIFDIYIAIIFILNFSAFGILIYLDLKKYDFKKHLGVPLSYIVVLEIIIMLILGWFTLMITGFATWEEPN